MWPAVLAEVLLLPPPRPGTSLHPAEGQGTSVSALSYRQETAALRAQGTGSGPHS